MPRWLVCFRAIYEEIDVHQRKGAQSHSDCWGKVNDQLTSCIRDTNSLKGRPCLALRPRRQDLPTHQNHGGHLSSAVMKFKQKSKSYGSWEQLKLYLKRTWFLTYIHLKLQQKKNSFYWRQPGSLEDLMFQRLSYI